MKISDTLSRAFDDQITLELQAAVVYRQLAIEMSVRDLPGMATWFAAQSAEELEHADKFTAHVADRGNHPRIGDIAAPALSIDSPLAAFRAALAHEEKVSAAIRALFRKARDEDDIDSVPLLHWFLDEQVEEEATVGEIVGRLELVAEDGPGLLRLDSELASRSTTED